MAFSSVQWTEAMDKLLIDGRVTRKIAWKAMGIIDAKGEAVALTECRSRLKFLQSNGGAPAAPAEDKLRQPNDRDGLLWLSKKKRLKHLQLLEGLYYRDLYRRGSTAGGGLKSSLADFGGVGGGKGQGGMMFGAGAMFDDARAQLELYVVRQIVLHGQDDVLTVMDGVCGLGHSLRYLAGGDQVRAAQLEAVLRVALDQMASVRKVKEVAQQNRAKAA